MTPPDRYAERLENLETGDWFEFDPLDMGDYAIWEFHSYDKGSPLGFPIYQYKCAHPGLGKWYVGQHMATSDPPTRAVLKITDPDKAILRQEVTHWERHHAKTVRFAKPPQHW